MERTYEAAGVGRKYRGMAWIRIVGLPLSLWGVNNFEAITRSFGRTISPFDEIDHRVDLSCVKIDIITDRRSRINDEIHVNDGGKVIKLGIIEFDEMYRNPFRFDSTPNPYEDEYGNEVNMTDASKEELDKGQPEGKENGETNEPEEGEILPEMEVEGTKSPLETIETEHEEVPESTSEELPESTSEVPAPAMVKEVEIIADDEPTEAQQPPSKISPHWGNQEND
ncbi:hypothetical protein LXL04_005634 [Taraxacum kok-saghyz]